MTPASFIATWSKADLSERSSYQQHFLDLCALVGHPTPATLDATGESFTFEKGTAKHEGGEGFADVWKRGFFAIEYKGKHKNLSRAYDQLLQYREALENPPLLVVCDTDRILIHTNFTGTAKRVYEITLASLDRPESLRLLIALLNDPEALRPGVTSKAITEDDRSDQQRTLTKLYNAWPAWLTNAHTALDAAVAGAYGWPPNIGDAEILARLLHHNSTRTPASDPRS